MTHSGNGGTDRREDSSRRGVEIGWRQGATTHSGNGGTDRREDSSRRGLDRLEARRDDGQGGKSGQSSTGRVQFAAARVGALLGVDESAAAAERQPRARPARQQVDGAGERVRRARARPGRAWERVRRAWARPGRAGERVRRAWARPGRAWERVRRAWARPGRVVLHVEHLLAVDAVRRPTEQSLRRTIADVRPSS